MPTQPTSLCTAGLIPGECHLVRISADHHNRELFVDIYACARLPDHAPRLVDSAVVTGKAFSSLLDTLRAGPLVYPGSGQPLPEPAPDVRMLVDRQEVDEDD